MDTIAPKARELPRRIPGAEINRAKVVEYFDQLRVEAYFVDAATAVALAASTAPATVPAIVPAPRAETPPRTVIGRVGYKYRPVEPSPSASRSAATA